MLESAQKSAGGLPTKLAVPSPDAREATSPLQMVELVADRPEPVTVTCTQTLPAPSPMFVNWHDAPYPFAEQTGSNVGLPHPLARITTITEDHRMSSPSYCGHPRRFFAPILFAASSDRW
jgi:hypothetical protein